MELGGVRASVFDYLNLRTELQADVSADELGTELNKTRSNVSRELNNLKNKGLASVVRWEDTGSRPKPYWQLSPAAAEAMSPGGQSFGSFDSFGNKINRINKINSQDSTAVPETESKRIIPPGTPVEINRDGNWSNGYVVHDASNLDSMILVKVGSPTVRLLNQRIDIDARPCESAFKQPEPEPEPVPSDPSQLDLDDLPF